MAGPSGPSSLAFGRVLQDLDVWHQTLAWVKDHFVIGGRADYQARHEQIFYGWVPGGRHTWFGGRARDSVLTEDDGRPVIVEDEGRVLVKIGQTTLAITGTGLAVEEVETCVVEVERPRRSREHPTMKPPRLIAVPAQLHAARAARVEQDAAGNIKPSKRKSTERIDGVVALVMALDRATRREGESVYEQRVRRGERALVWL